MKRFLFLLPLLLLGCAPAATSTTTALTPPTTQQVIATANGNIFTDTLAYDAGVIAANSAVNSGKITSPVILAAISAAETTARADLAQYQADIAAQNIPALEADNAGFNAALNQIATAAGSAALQQEIGNLIVPLPLPLPSK